MGIQNGWIIIGDGMGLPPEGAMKKSIAILVILAALVMVAVAMSAHTELLNQENLGRAHESSKIDSSLEKKISLGENGIPFIILFRGSDEPDTAELEAASIKVRHRYHLINGVAAMGSAKAIQELAEKEWVDSIHLDGSVHTARPVRAVDGSDALSPSKIVNAQALWSQGINGSGVRVAIIDSGIDKNHPDLVGKVVGEVNFVEEEDTTDDLMGHGTMCAGIIAGSGLASGGKYAGIAPGASLLNVRVIDSSGDGRVSDIISGIEWALDHDADVMSLSLGGMNLGETNPPITLAADDAMDAGVVVFVAAGNSG